MEHPFSPEASGPVVRLETLTVSALPASHELYPLSVLTVRSMGEGWVVTRGGGRWLARSGTWEFGGQQPGDEDTWVAGHRFTLPEALAAATAAAQQLRVRGRTAAQICADDEASATLRNEAARAAEDLRHALRHASAPATPPLPHNASRN